MARITIRALVLRMSTQPINSLRHVVPEAWPRAACEGFEDLDQLSGGQRSWI
jgi:hypothetical protein